MSAESPEVRLDKVHERAVEVACGFDRRFAEDHPEADWLVRPAVPHELCLPGWACSTATWVRVDFIEPGVRARYATAAPA